MNNEFDTIIKAGIAESYPHLAPFFDRSESLAEYASTLYIGDTDAVHLERQQKLVTMMANYTERVHGERIEPTLPMTINVVDHHTLMNSPIIVSGNIVAHAHQLLGGASKPTFVFSSSITPQDNFHSLMTYGSHRLQFFSKKEQRQSTCFLPVHEFVAHTRLQQSKQWSTMSEHERQFVLEMEAWLGSIDVSRARNLNDQMSILVRPFWKRLFAPDVQPGVPDMLYVPNEDIIRKMIETVLSRDTIIGQVLFDPELRNRALEVFDGGYGCWDSERGKGTHFFWHRKANGRVEPMTVEGDELVTADYRLALEPEALVRAVRDGDITPALWVIYTWTVFWNGVTPLVGYGSLGALTELKNRWLQLLADVDPEEAERVASVQTNRLIAGLLTAFTRVNGQIEKLHGFDVIDRGGFSREYLEQLLKMPFNALLAPAAIDIYNTYVPEEHRKPHSVDPQDVMGAEFDWIPESG